MASIQFCMWVDKESETPCMHVFSSPEDLHSHLDATHVTKERKKKSSTERPDLSCRWKGCGLNLKQFTKRNHVICHMRSHIEHLREFHCDSCGKTFKYKHDQRRHEMRCQGATRRSPSPLTRKRRRVMPSLLTTGCHMPSPAFSPPTLSQAESPDDLGGLSPDLEQLLRDIGSAVEIDPGTQSPTPPPKSIEYHNALFFSAFHDIADFSTTEFAPPMVNLLGPSPSGCTAEMMQVFNEIALSDLPAHEFDMIFGV